MVAVGGEAWGATAAGAVGLESPVGEGEEQPTRGRKVLPPRVFTILEHEKEKKGGGGLQVIETGCEMKRKERKKALYREGGGGGGGGGGANERSWPINGLKCLLNGLIKKKGKLMVSTRNGGFAADGR